MKTILCSIICVLSTSLLFAQKHPQILNETDFSIGKSINIKSEILAENRTLNIYLPFSYEKDSSKTYPVIYLLDGSKEEDFIHIAGLVQFGSFSWINMLPESIVIGISNVDRKRDFTAPSANELDQKEFPTSGGSKTFINFIEEELQPFVKANFRTADNRTLIGQSLGGLLATEILFSQAELFDNYIIVSPSLWWNNENLLKETPSQFENPKSIYIAVGKEGEVMERTAKALHSKLKSNVSAADNLYFEFLEDKTHGDALHLAVYHAFEQIFKSTNNKQK